MAATSPVALDAGVAKFEDAADRAERVVKAQAMVTEFNTRLSAVLCQLVDRGIPILMVLEILAEHQAKVLALAEPRSERKEIRERITETIARKLALAELQKPAEPQIKREPGHA